MDQSYVKVKAETRSGQDIDTIYEREIYEIEMAADFEALLFHKVLRLGGYKLRGLPSSLSSLQRLCELQLENNAIEELPCSFGQLKIRLLYLQHNRLRLLPDTFAELTALQHLRLDHNQLAALPENFGNLQELQWLELHSNALEFLPESFCRLGKLCQLKIEENRLVELPVDFGKLGSLKALVATSNCLTALPESFTELPSLQHLSLELNRIAHLPENFDQLVSLERLYLGGNRVLSLPRSLTTSTTCSLGPLNRFRVMYPRISWFLRLGTIEFKSSAPCDEDGGCEDTGKTVQFDSRNLSSVEPSRIGKS